MLLCLGKYKKQESWKVYTWSKWVNYIEILKLGTKEDIGNLSECTIKKKGKEQLISLCRLIKILDLYSVRE